MNDYKTTIGSSLLSKIVNFAEETSNQGVLDEISIYGTGEKDGSAVLSFEWNGTEDAHNFGAKVLDFMQKIQKIVIDSGKEAVEQLPPHVNIFNTGAGDMIVALYRVRVWPENGDYELKQAKLMEK